MSLIAIVRHVNIAMWWQKTVLSRRRNAYQGTSVPIFQRVRKFMANSSDRSFFRHPMGRLGLFMAALFALWFGGWFVFASFADGKIAEVLQSVKDRGINIDCKNREIRGFPFRIGVHCDDLDVAHKRDVFRIKTGEVRTAAQLYAPGELIAEVDGPFQSWPNGRELNANWSIMRLFLDANFSGGFDLASLTFSDLTSTLSRFNFGVAKGAVHFRPTPLPQDASDQSPVSLDGAVSLSDLSAQLPNLNVPPATFEADGTLMDGYQDLVERRRPLRSVIRDGAKFEIRNLALSLPDGGRLAFAGPLEVDSDGLLTGKIRVGVAKPESVSNWAGAIDPRLTQYVALIAQGVAGMGQPAQFGSAEIPSIVITLDRGQARMGFIQLGDPIPPLF